MPHIVLIVLVLNKNKIKQTAFYDILIFDFGLFIKFNDTSNT